MPCSRTGACAPRHADRSERERRAGDVRGARRHRLLAITHIGGGLALLFGALTLAAFAHANTAYLQQGWLHAKLALVALLIAYHAMLTRMTGEFARDANRRSSRWLRLFNEAPALLLIAIVLLVVLKPA